MALDPNIILQARAPQITVPDNLGTYAKILGLKNAQAQGELQSMQLEQAKQGMADDQAVRSAYQAGGDSASILERLRGAGQYKAAQAVEKQMLDAQKVRADLGKTQSETTKNAFAIFRDQIGAAQGPQDAAQLMAAAYADPVLSPIIGRAGSLEQAVQRIPQDPRGFAEWKMRGAMAMDKVLSAQNAEAVRLETERRNREVEARARDAEARAAANAPFIATPGGAVPNVPVQNYEISKTAAGRPQAPRLQYDAERGAVIDLTSGVATPINSAGGEPLPQKMTEAQRKEILSINQQNSVIDGALRLVEATPSAFSFRRGAMTKAGEVGETVAGRFDSPQETEARSAVFNIVSKVINERAGAAQSAQELARLRSFLPADMDNAEQIKNKLTGFKKYLADLETGSRQNPNAASAPGRQTFADMPDPTKYAGRSIRDDVSGVTYKSVGGKWVRQ